MNQRSTEPTGLTPPTRAGLRSVRRLTTRKHREAEGQFLAEGRQAVREALAWSTVQALWVDRSRAREHADLLEAAGEAGVACYGVEEHTLAGLADTVTPQGVIAQVHTPRVQLAEALGQDPQLVVVCAQIRDPGNLGAVIRVADAFGADAVVTTSGSVEWTNPKVVRASVGSVFHLPIVSGVGLAQTAEALRERGVQILAADGGGEDLQARAATGRLAVPTAWVMGNEAWGLPAEDRALADAVVAVPIWGHAESLNLATAAAVCLWTTASAQRSAP